MKTTRFFGQASTHRGLALVCGLIALTFGAVVLIGWAIDNAALKTFFPGLVTMKANTALGLAMCGGAVALLACSCAMPQLRHGALSLAAMTVALGLATLSQYFFNWNLGIDELLFRDTGDVIWTSGPGRMAPSTAFCFTLAGIAIGILSQPILPRLRFPIVSAIAATLLLIGGAGTIGQLINGVFRLDFWNFSGMAMHTALGFVSLGAGLMELVRSENGITWTLGATITVGFVAAVTIMLSVACVSWNYTYRLQQEGALVSHSSEVLREIENIRAGMAGRESSQRGYVILGDEHLLDQRAEMTAGVIKDIDILRQLTVGDPAQQQRLDEVEKTVEKRTEFGDQVIEARRRGGFPAAQKMIATGVGMALTADLKRSITAMRDSEYAMLVSRQKSVSATATSTFLLLPSGIFFSLFILSLALFFLNMGMSEERQTRERLRATIKDVSDLKYALDEHTIVAMTDPLGVITYVNDKFCQISQHARAELIGQDYRIVNSGYHPEEFFRNLWTMIAAGQVWHGEIQNRSKQGNAYWVDTTVVPFLNEEGKPRQYVAICTDITERKMTEEANKLLASIVNCSNDAIIGKDLNSIVTSWNAGAERIFGYSTAEMLGQSITRLIPPDRMAEEKAIIDKVIAGESVEHFETMRAAKDGRLINISVTVSPIKDKDGRIVGASKVARDITEQKAAREALRESEKQIRELNVKLEQRVAERTAELEAANKELEAFSYSVSHDLRSPLRAVDGFSQAVIEDYAALLPEQGRKDLQTIRSAAQRMGSLIDDLLAFSGLGRTAMKTQEIDTTKMVRDVVEELRDQQKGRKVEIILKELPPCHGDPALLNQVWVNLISNALKYTSKRPVTVIEIGSRPGGVYYVRDNGAGFDMRYAQKLFGVFQRLHRLDEFVGTGVGLAIVHRIITRHGGLIWAEAKPDSGATFHFTLTGAIAHD